MGLTLKCARCHDHKFDPLSQKDYYRFFAFFNSVPERGIDGATGNAVPLMRFPSREQRKELVALNAALASRQQALETYRKKSSEKATAWANKRRAKLAGAVESDSEPNPLYQLLQLDAAERTDAQRQDLIRAFLSQDKTFQELKSAVNKAEREREKFENKISSTMVMRDSEEMRSTYLLNRGMYDQPGEQVTAGVPAIFPPLPKNALGNRLSLARWLVSDRHPLTARVTVNRFWQSIFGNGIVKTSENFGSQGSLPSHAALLDWLAARFIRSGWDVKDLMRLLVTSATYRQSSRITEESFQRDPENRLLARGPRVRLQAEMIRDASLAASGLLVRTVGGASVRPYQPAGLWEEVAFGIKTYGAQKYEQDHRDALYRRSMYTFWKRTSPPPSMIAFDAPTREVCSVERSRTNTPIQALVLLNDPQ